ncbi:hypothetical protein NP233_g3892 [Leucocoprinus birnbaumii]|uniref:Ubiquitin 3 binding protein But2 C-terminal domain-containing protein n=1 Tax=Leucocoprinus birnbaumii TaxID=56174 RepID=A0AAD5YY18_9AGAR|nr:hypothetical protein NP233_g3892 [Leucocoprinus birnbaumii]
MPRLRRPNQYINLDKVQHNHNFPPITNFPDIVLRINTNDSGRVMEEDSRMPRTNVGTIHTDDRHIYVTPEVSTIIQFRHMDYGMEKCSLYAILPDYVEEKEFIGSSVDVWLLDSSTEFSRQTLPEWPVAPQRRRLLTSFTFSSSDGPVIEFDCPSYGLTTLELACSSSMPCQVDFWQDKRRVPLGGVYVIQKSNAPPKQ